MAVTLGRLGPQKALALFADWTDRIAAGELPFAKPERPQGVERNIVLSMWEWSTPKAYLHDAISTDKRNPRVNANGLIYGSPEESTDMVPVLNPITNEAWQVKHPYPRSRHALLRKTCREGTRLIGATSRSGTATPASTTRSSTRRDECGSPRAFELPQNPDFCKAGSDHPSAKVAPLNESGRQLSMYDPKTEKWSLIDTCFSTQHLYFAQRRQQHAVDQRRRSG